MTVQIKFSNCFCSLLRSIFFYVVLLLTGFVELKGQSPSIYILSPVGGKTQMGNLNIDWSIGEPVIAPARSGGVSLTQGFLQPSYTELSVQASSN